MRFLLIGILLGFPLLEAVVLVRLSQTLGWWVLAWVVLSACAGMALIKEARFTLLLLPRSEAAQHSARPRVPRPVIDAEFRRSR